MELKSPSIAPSFSTRVEAGAFNSSHASFAKEKDSRKNERLLWLDILAWPFHIPKQYGACRDGCLFPVAIHTICRIRRQADALLSTSVNYHKRHTPHIDKAPYFPTVGSPRSAESHVEEEDGLSKLGAALVESSPAVVGLLQN